MSDKYAPKPEHKFTFGLWTVGNIGRDPFGGPVRDTKSPLELVVLATSWSILVFEAKCIKLRITPLSQHDFIVPNQFGNIRIPDSNKNNFVSSSFSSAHHGLSYDPMKWSLARK